jgi:steroid delta-isomerase
MSEQAVRAHIDLFNTAVTTGDWSAFVAGFHPDAVMTFVGPPVGPFTGRDAIAEAYAADPPDDTMRMVAASRDGGADIVTFAWSRGGTGTMTLHYRDDLISALTVTFDESPARPHR